MIGLLYDNDIAYIELQQKKAIRLISAEIKIIENKKLSYR